MGTESTLQMEIGYGEDGVSLTVKVDATPNQEKVQRAHTLEQTLKRQNIPYDSKDQLVRVYLRNEGDLERTLECFRIFEKQDKSREIRLNVHKKIATELETKLKSIFPPPEAAISVKDTGGRGFLNKNGGRTPKAPGSRFFQDSEHARTQSGVEFDLAKPEGVVL